MNPIKQLAGQTAIYGLSSIVPRFLNYLLVPLYTHIFAPSEYGIITELYAYVTFLIILLTYGMETGFFRFCEETKNSKKIYSTALFSLFVTSIIFLIFVLTYLSNIAEILMYPENKEFIMYFGLILSIDAFIAIPFAKLRLENKAFKFASIKIFNVIINIGFNLVFLVIIPGFYGSFAEIPFLTALYTSDSIVGFVFISNLIASFFTLIYLLPEIFKFKFKLVDLSILKDMLIYSLPLLLAGLAGSLNEAIDRIMLKHLLPSGVNALEQIGLYGANIKIAVLMTLFIQMFRYAAEPFFFLNAKEKNSKILFADVSKYFIVFGLVIFLFVTGYLDIIKYFIHSSYWQALNIVPVMLIAYLFLGIFFNFSIWYKLNNLTIYGAFLTFFGLIITIIINYFFIPKYGYYASAWAHLFSSFGMVVLSYIIGQRFYKIKYDIKNFLFYFGLSAVLYIIMYRLRYIDTVFLIILNSLFILVFIIIVYLKEKKYFYNNYVLKDEKN